MAPQGTILFINKSAKSKTLTQSEGAEKKKIYSHVQQLPVSKPSDKSLLRDWKVSTISVNPLDKETNYPSRKKDEDGSRPRRKKTKALCKSKHADESDWNISTLFSRTTISITKLEASKIDPFNCSAVHLDDRISETLKIFVSSVVNQIFTYKTWAHASLRHVLSHASQSPELLYATLCATSGRALAKSKDKRHGFDLVYFKGLAMRALRGRVDKRVVVDVATMRAVCALMQVECAEGELDAARHHYKALREMVETATDLETTPLSMRTSLVIPAFFCTLVLSEPPIKISISSGRDEDEIDAYATELLTRFDTTLTSPDQASRFSNPATESLLGPELCAFITRIHAIESTTQDLQSLFAQRIALAQDLQPMTPTTATPSQTAIRIALYLCLAPTNAAQNLAPLFKRTLREQLLPALKATDLANMWFPYLDLFLWVLCVTSWACEGEDAEEVEWMVSMAGRVARMLGIMGKGELEELLKGFIWPERSLGGSLEGFLEKMQNAM